MKREKTIKSKYLSNQSNLIILGQYLRKRQHIQEAANIFDSSNLNSKKIIT